MSEIKDPTLLAQLNATGEDSLKGMDPGRAAIVRAMAEGRQGLPAGYSMRSPYAQGLLADAARLDPTFDAANLPSRIAAQKAFTSGKQGQNISSFNTALGHLDTLAQRGEELNNRSIPAWNGVANWLETATGDPRVTNFNTARQAVVDELTRAFRGSGGNVSDIQEWERQLNSSRSPAQLRGAIQQAGLLLGSRIDALKQSYNTSMGTTDKPLPLLTPHAQDALTRLGSKDYIERGAAALGDVVGPGASGKTVDPLSVDNVTDAVLGLRDRKPGPPHQEEDGKVSVRMPDGTLSIYSDRAAYEHAMAEDQLAAQNGGDRGSEGYRDAYKKHFGEEAPIVVDVEGGQAARKPVDAGDGATGAFARGVGDSATFGGLDELGGVVDTLGGTQGRRNVWNSGLGFGDILAENILRNRKIIAGDEREHPWARVGGELVGGAAVPFGAGARTAGELAKVGAIGGGLYGFGSGEGNPLQRVPNALSGAVAGAVGGYAFGRLAPSVGGALSRFGSGTSPVRVEADALAQAGARQGVPMTAGDLRPGARNVLSYLEASPGGSGPVRDALAAGDQGLEAAVGRVGGGTAQTPEAIGTTIQNAGRRAIDWSRQIKDDMYAHAERLAGGATMPATSAVATLDRNIAELSQTPNANRGVLDLLADMRADLTDQAGNPRQMAVGAIRNLRTAMRGEIGSRNLTMTDAERRVSQVIDAASGDIHSGLSRTNSQAATAYQRADQFYAQRQQYINDVIAHYTGPRDRPYSGEQTYARIMALTGAKGDRAQLAETMRALNPTERADVASTVAAQLGRRTSEDDFSPARFVTQAENMTPGAREAVFGQEGADAINDLIRIAAAKRDTARMLNHSRSGQVSNYDRLLTGALGIFGGAGGMAAGGVEGAAAGALGVTAAKAGALNLSARMLTNPRFVQWLGRAPTSANPTQVQAHVRQLAALAIREPTIRGDVQRLLSQIGGKGAAASNSSPNNQSDGDDYQPAAAAR